MRRGKRAVRRCGINASVQGRLEECVAHARQSMRIVRKLFGAASAGAVGAANAYLRVHAGAESPNMLWAMMNLAGARPVPVQISTVSTTDRGWHGVGYRHCPRAQCCAGPRSGALAQVERVDEALIVYDEIVLTDAGAASTVATLLGCRQRAAHCCGRALRVQPCLN